MNDVYMCTFYMQNVIKETLRSDRSLADTVLLFHDSLYLHPL